MSVPVAPRPRRADEARPLPLAVPLALLALAAATGIAAATAAPVAVRAWVAGTAAAGWLSLVLACLTATVLLRRARRAATDAGHETVAAHAELARTGTETARLADVTLPAVVTKVREGACVESALGAVPLPVDGPLRRVVEVVAAEVAEGERRVGAALSERDAAVGRLAESNAGLDRLMTDLLPPAQQRLRKGESTGVVLAGIAWPDDARHRTLLETVIKALGFSERRSFAAALAGRTALREVQAKAVTLLGDLREMEDRCDEDMFSDLLTLDHNTSQLGLYADRLAILLDGRGSRIWNRPIIMESILRGAVGRISAYRRVRMHSAGQAHIVGYAAEGVMHLLAELMDNAVNFSAPTDEVHVHVEERAAGIVVTVEDSGMPMSEPALRHAEECVSGRANDLAMLKGNRLGLTVVGRLAEKFHMTVSIRPSATGGTGVIVLIPPRLIAPRLTAIEAERLRRRPARAAVPPATSGTPAPRALRPAPAEQPAPVPAPFRGGPRVATQHGLPVRPPGRTMAAADRHRPQEQRGVVPAAPAKDIGAEFSAFHRSTLAAQASSAPHQES